MAHGGRAGVGRWPMEGGQGGRWGGTKKQCGHCFKPNNWSDLAGDEGGGMGGRRGEVAHGGRARGEMGRGTKSSVHCFFFFWAP